MADPEEMTEEVVDKIAEALPEFTQSMTKFKVQFGLLGGVIGTAAGALVAWGIAYRKAEMKYSQWADDEIAEMREHYQAKGRALEAEAGKGDLDTLVKNKGYASSEPTMSASPPMAVQPPSRVAESEDEQAAPDDSAMAEDEVEGPNGVKTRGEKAVRNIFQEHKETATPAWDAHAERRRRNPDTPYVIHHDEKDAMDGYSDVSFTYYAADDVLCNERDEVVDPAERDNMVGDANLDRFGHGSGSPEIVFVRNDNLEMVFEIVRSPNSFAEEVHGFTHEGWDRGNVERMRRRERDEEG